MKMVHIYQTDFGAVLLPADFPAVALRKDGRKADRRYSIANVLDKYIESIQEAARQMYVAGKGVHGLRAMSFTVWLKS